MSINMSKDIISDMGILSNVAYEEYGGASRVFLGAQISSDKDQLYYLSSSYTVIDYTSTSTDMQALLLAKNDISGNPTDEYVIAFRGTEPNSFFDIGTDVIIGLDNYNLQFEDAKAFVQAALNRTDYNITQDNLTLTGHSLGGILTQSVGAVLGIKGYAFDPYGTERLLTMWPTYGNNLVEALVNVGIYQVLNAFGLESSYATFAKENILNISYNDFGIMNGDILSNFASAFSSDHLGSYLAIFGENVGLSGHKLSVMNQAIQNYNDILYYFTTDTTYADLSTAYALGGTDGFNSVNTIFNNLGIYNATPGSLAFDFLLNKTPGELESGVPSHFYALLNLNPFAITGLDYTPLNQNGLLDITNYSDQFIEDRALFLNNTMHETQTTESFSTRYIDEELNRDAFVQAEGDPMDVAYVTFGTESADQITGAGQEDHLYGMGGNDTLIGGAGDDYIEGGKGNDVLQGGLDSDTYVFTNFGNGEGKDIIYDGDVDDPNKIIIGDNTLLDGSEAQIVKVDPVRGIFRWEGSINYEWDQMLQTITISSGDDSITIKDISHLEWLKRRFGIELSLEPKAALIVENTNPFIDADFTAATLSSSIQEASSSKFNLALNQQLPAGAKIIIRATDISSDLIKLVTGDEVLGFSNGEVVLDATAGQSFYSFAILQQGELDADTTATFTATIEWTDIDGVDHSFSTDNSFELTINNVESSPVPGEIQTDNDIFGDPVDNSIVDTPLNDHIMSGGGDDWITQVFGGNDYIEAGEGNDVVDGGHNGTWNLVINGGGGRDYLSPYDGDDIIEGGTDGDALFGFEGNDIIFGTEQGETADFILNGATQEASGAQGDWVDAGYGDDRIFTEEGNDLVSAGDGQDLIVTGGGNDFIFGDGYTWQDVYLWEDWQVIVTEEATADGGTINHYEIENINIDGDPGTGDDTIYAGAGDDVVFGQGGNDTIYLEAGNDTGWGGENSDVILGGAGADLIIGDNSVDVVPEEQHGDDFLDGGEGADLLYGNGGSDILYGGAGDDELVGDDSNQQTAGNDYLNGEAGNDILYGGGGRDTLLGGDGDDELYGEGAGAPESQQQDDYLNGGAGNDLLVGGGGGDTLLGGDGNDQLWGEAGDTPDDLQGDDTLDGGEGDDTLVGGGGSDTLLGGEGNDQLWGETSDTPDGLHGNDTLYGGAGDDYLEGGGGADTLFGGDGIDELFGGSDADILAGDAGNDTLAGDAGDDTLDGGDDNDQLYGDEGNDTLDGGDGDDYLYGHEGDDSMVGGAGNDELYGGAGSDTLSGGDGNDWLSGGTGNDIMSGGNGDDRYYFSLGSGVKHILDSDGYNRLILQEGINLDTIELSLGPLMIGTGMAGDEIHLGDIDFDDLEGTSSIQEIQFSDGQSFTLEELVASVGIDITTTEDADSLLGTSVRDNISTLAGNDVVDAGGGNDIIYLGSGNDVVYCGSGDDTANGGDGDDTMWGDEGSDTLYGDSGVDTLYGGEGNDLLDGGDGDDILNGGTGDDTYGVDSLGDQVVELANEGTDTIVASIDYTLGDNVENLQLAENASAINGTGNLLDNSISGNSLDNFLEGLDGNDTLLGGSGNDTLIGEAGGDLLDGGPGDDVMQGGEGDDLYIVDSTADQIIEGSGQGYDRVESSVSFQSYQLAANVEALFLTGRYDAGIGNELDNYIVGSSTRNQLEGLAGNDELDGFTGDDTLLGGEGDDYLYGGDDTGIHSNMDYLDGGVGNDHLDGGSSDDELYGGVGDDYLYGGDNFVGEESEFPSLWSNEDYLDGEAGNDYLDGGSGDDTLVGGDGDDYLYGGDGEAQDLSYWEKRYLDLPLTNDDYLDGGAGNDVLDGGNGHDWLEGGEGEDTLYGGSMDDILDGGLGIDYMAGGIGDDEYYVDGYASIAYNYITYITDTVVEEADSGWDYVYSSITYSLTDNVEELILIGSEDMDGTGNDLDNWIVGNGGDNRIDGGLGHDYMEGWEGNDTYLVDNSGDQVFEQADQGTDTVQSSVSYALGDHIERLTLSGSDAIDATGNELDNRLLGNDAANVLSGNDGDDQLYGYAGNDTLDGGSGNDYLNGGEGSDTMSGGDGHDTYLVDNLGDQVIEAADQGTDTVQSSVSYALGDHIERLTLSGSDAIDATGNELDNRLLGNDAANVLSGNDGDDQLYGYAGNDTLDGGSGNDYLNGGEGSDTMSGGDGHDTYLVDNLGDQVIEAADQGTDTVQSSVSYALGDNVERLTLSGSDAIDATGNELDNRLLGNDAANVLSGNDGDDQLYGYAGNDTLDGGSGNDYLNGGEGSDTMSGIDGHDTYLVDNLGDQVIEAADQGTDTVQSSVSYALGDHIERLTLSGSDAIDATGNELDNRLLGNDAANVLSGNDGDDQLYGYAGDDTLDGGSGNDYLNGGEGSDTMSGGDGHDTYLVDNSGDQVFEQADQGTDTVQSSVSYALGDHIERLTLSGSDAIDATGNELDNRLLGNDAANVLSGNDGDDQLYGYAGNDTLDGGSGNDYLNGGEGSDTMSGIDGHDTYLVDNLGDQVIEAADQGTDTVQSSVSYALGDHIERLTLSGSDAIDATGNELDNRLLGNDAANVLSGNDGDDQLYGYAGNDTLDGGSGNDYLNGGEGSDTMSGGDGHDTYLVDNLGDQVIEAADQGTDTVQSSVSYALGDNVERLTLSGSDAIDATGNELDNRLLGNDAANVLSGNDGDDQLYGYAGNDTLDGGSGNDYLNGGEGSDTMSGGDGHDTYLVDNLGDQVIEAADQGTDTVQSSVSYALGDNVERLTLSGSDAIDATGNDLDNCISGNDAANSMTGHGGNDYLYGYAGDDTLDGGAGNDYLNGGEGNDYMAGGDGDDKLYGYAGDDTLYGEAGDDRLYGYAGDDTLDGGSGNDCLNGGEGIDTYLFGINSGSDSITDYDTATGQNDTIAFSEGLTSTDIGLFKNGNDLVLGIAGSSDTLTVENWFQSENYQVENVELTDGYYLTDTDINQLIQQMSAYAVDQGIAFNNINDVYNNQDLMTMVANSWHQG